MKNIENKEQSSNHKVFYLGMCPSMRSRIEMNKILAHKKLYDPLMLAEEDLKKYTNELASKEISYTNMIKFVQSHLLGDMGSTWGLPIMGDPSTTKRYKECKEMLQNAGYIFKYTPWSSQTCGHWATVVKDDVSWIPKPFWKDELLKKIQETTTLVKNEKIKLENEKARIEEKKILLKKLESELQEELAYGRELDAKLRLIKEINAEKTKVYQMKKETNEKTLENMDPKKISFVLQKSIEQNNQEFVKIFINKEFNPDFQNINGETLLHTAVKLRDKPITKEHQLLDKVLSKNPSKVLQDKDGNTALLLSVKAQDIDLMAKLMTPNGLYVENLAEESPFSVMETQLFNAVDNNNIEFVQKLSTIVPDYSRFTREDKPLLYTALEQNKIEMAKLFLGGMSPEKALLTAVKASKMDVVEKLLTLVDTIDFQTPEGHELLTLVTPENHQEFIPFLNSVGAEIGLMGESHHGDGNQGYECDNATDQ